MRYQSDSVVICIELPIQVVAENTAHLCAVLKNFRDCGGYSLTSINRGQKYEAIWSLVIYNTTIFRLKATKIV